MMIEPARRRLRDLSRSRSPLFGITLVSLISRRRVSSPERGEESLSARGADKTDLAALLPSKHRQHSFSRAERHQPARAAFCAPPGVGGGNMPPPPPPFPRTGTRSVGWLRIIRHQPLFAINPPSRFPLSAFRSRGLADTANEGVPPPPPAREYSGSRRVRSLLD